jgi:nucleotide-binding universal stress UspA family protein
MTNDQQQYRRALEEFRRLRQRADRDRLAARLTGRSSELLPFDEVRRLLHVAAHGERELREIPLSAIVGSVGRYQDFDRNFLPLRDSDAQRWAHVAAAVDSPGGVPPIEVYQVGGSFFVADGNHRVSVARRHGHTLISAYVTRLSPRVTPAEDEFDAQAVLLAAELTELCERTGLDQACPIAQLRVTELGSADGLLQAIEAYRSMHLPDSDLPTAAAAWYAQEFVPLCRLVEQRGLLQDAPQRTVADFYLWLRAQRSAAQQRLGWQLDDSTVAGALQRHEPRLDQLLDRLLPAALEPSTHSGSWRRDREVAVEDWLFHTVLVPISGEAGDWRALDQALTLTAVESSVLLGLHVVAEQRSADDRSADAVCSEFSRRCRAAGVNADCAVEHGAVGRVLRERTHWADLMVLPLNHPPSASPLARLTSSLRALIRGSACPVLVLPTTTLTRARHLLAGFDGSERAREALVLAAYLTARWQRQLSVVATADDAAQAAHVLAEAEQILAGYGVTATLHAGRGDAADAILIRAETVGADLILLGGYGGRGVLDLVLGSVTEALLRTSRIPLLICQ